MNLSDEIILNEIRESLALSQRLRARSKKDGAEKVQSSPYDVKHAAGTIPNAKKPVKDSKLDENKSGTMQVKNCGNLLLHVLSFKINRGG